MQPSINELQGSKYLQSSNFNQIIKVNWSKQLTMMIALIVQSIVASSGKNFYIQVICMVVIIYKQKDIVKKIFNRLVKKESIK